MRIIKKIFKFTIIMAFTFILLILGLYGYAKISPKLEIKTANSISLYDSHNNLYFQGNGGKEWTNLNDISKYVIDATIITEDKNFYSHHGFDILRIFKALYINIINKSKKQGASTITQQYAKNLFLDFDKTWERKFNEMWLTIQIESHYSKDEILEGYLNTINYGHGMYGIQNAAKYYFDKNAKDLTLAESAILIGIPKSPSNYSPLVNPELAKARQERVLRTMYLNNLITEEEMNNAMKEELTYVGKKDLINLSTVMYYQNAVMKELETIKSIPSSYLDTGGLKIYTNLDINAQTILENNIKENIGDKEKLEISAIMMNPNNGKIIALVGGKDYSKSQYNRATDSKRQVGSVMKPLLYYAALENGFTSSTTFKSEETTFTFQNNTTYSPKNYNNTYGNKPISLATAIAYSDNIYAVKTHLFLGEEALVDMASRVGIKTKLTPIPSLPLGTVELNIIEITSAYAAFANEGYKVTPYLINRVEDIEGNVLYSYESQKENVLNRSLVFILNELLTGTYDANFIDYNYPTTIGIAPKMTRKYAIKSGSTATDSWIVGFNKDIVTSIWIGNDKNKELEIEDFKHGRNIWIDTMEKYLKDTKSTWYSMPINVVGVLVDPITGIPTDMNSKKKKILYYIKGTEPNNETSVFDEIE